MTSPRMRIPTLLDAAWDSALIMTYGADLEFYEQHLLPLLSRSRNRVIFSDGRQTARRFTDANNRVQLRQANRTYVIAPVQADRAAHAKLIMLLSEDRGLLAVGSGNLSMSGYASQGECFSSYHWSQDDPSQRAEFLAARDFIDQVCEKRLVDSFVRARVQQAWRDAPWLYGKAEDSGSRVRHNLDRALLDQFAEAVNGRTVDELVVHAPFYDHGCEALAELIQRMSPAMLQVLLQERLTSVDPGRLTAVLDAAPGRRDVRSVQAPDAGTFLHAKFLIARSEGIAVCLQGSPNISSSALLGAYPYGNIELANLLIGERTAFDHLINSLVVSPDSIDITQLGLSLTNDGDDDEHEAPPRYAATELSWVTPRLSGVFDREVLMPPQLIIDGAVVAEVAWELSEPSAGRTGFAVRLDEEAASALNGVAAVRFIFETGEETLPTFPYHVNALNALASGQGRTDLLKRAGDFDLGDTELEELLAQLDAALVVDRGSIWRMLKRKAPEASDDDTSISIAYDELDWDAIQSHPKLAQYRNWDQRSASDPTDLGILLTSIAERFEADVRRGRTGDPGADGPDSSPDELDDLAKAIEAEDEEAAEENEAIQEQRRLSQRSRAKRQFHSFVKRFVNGLTDKEFIRHVGPPVIVPSYVVFNHLCWKLIQIDLADPVRIINAQTALWAFFWGEQDESGYFAALSTAEQEAALDILDRHHSEAVLLCSLFQAHAHTRHEPDDRALIEIRDAWRTVLPHPLWQPTKPALDDSTTLLRYWCKTTHDLIEKLDTLASYVSDGEPPAIVGQALGCRPEQVAITSGRVNRGSQGTQHVPIYTIEDPDASLTPGSASRAFSSLIALHPDVEYIRLEDRSHDVIAFADFQNDDFLHMNRATDDSQVLDPPATETPPWRTALKTLYDMAGAEVAAT